MKNYFQPSVLFKPLSAMTLLLFSGVVTHVAQAQPYIPPHSYFTIVDSDVVPEKDKKFFVTTPDGTVPVYYGGTGKVRAEESDYWAKSVCRILIPSSTPGTPDGIYVGVGQRNVPVAKGQEISLPAHSTENLPAGNYIVEYQLSARYPPPPRTFDPDMETAYTDEPLSVKHSFYVLGVAGPGPAGPGGGGPALGG